MKLLKLPIVILLFVSCNNKKDSDNRASFKLEFNQDLVDTLEQMVAVDQIAAGVPQGKYKDLGAEQWKLFKDSVYRTHEKQLQKIFTEFGFLGFDLVGKKGSQNFWLMVQHSDHNINFQKKVLKAMKHHVDNNNASPSDYAFLVDRIKTNSGEAQVYGSQVDYNWKVCQAFSKKILDSANVNKRRKAIGLEPLEVYLNEMSELHFEINKDIFIKNGITKPKLYVITKKED